jgi:hypothetical protein
MSKYRYVVECFLCNNNSCFRIRILDLIYFLYMLCVVSYCITCCILTMSSTPLASTCLAHAPSWDESKNKLMVENRSTTPQRGGSGGGGQQRGRKIGSAFSHAIPNVGNKTRSRGTGNALSRAKPIGVNKVPVMPRYLA